MRILGYIPDHRIKACNACIELTIKEYIDISKDIVDKNEFQRKKVISSVIKKTLKEDLKQKCTIPPIVLGIKDNKLPKDFSFETFANDEALIAHIKQKELIILDGLQRTYVLLELSEEDPGGDWINQVLRCEIYVGLEKLGILYRMLTLNTGQTTMSTRHLLEILYFDYLDASIEGIKLVLDKDGLKINDPLNEYKFKEVIEGYNSFIEGKEVPIERADILQNIETLNNLSKTSDQKEGFKAFLLLFNKLLRKLHDLNPSFHFGSEASQLAEYQISSNPFGKTTVDIFGKSQSLTGFGSALNFLKKNRNKTFNDISDDLDKVTVSNENTLYILLKHFDYIRNKSKKVGNDQRYYFRIAFQVMFDPAQEANFDLSKAVEAAYVRLQERLED
jgi:hypothetical protein